MKLDLHTHCREATACPKPTPEIARRIVDAVKAKGLDGIAVTDHNVDYYGYELRELVDHHLNDDIVIIPGKEIDKMVWGPQKGAFHLVELYLPYDVTFRFIAHPGHPYVKDLDTIINGDIHGIELRNHVHGDGIDEEKIRQLAEKHNLILLTNSDAHDLNDIGRFYNNIEIEELCARARCVRADHA